MRKGVIEIQTSNAKNAAADPMLAITPKAMDPSKKLRGGNRTNSNALKIKTVIHPFN